MSSLQLNSSIYNYLSIYYGRQEKFLLGFSTYREAVILKVMRSIIRCGYVHYGAKVRGRDRKKKKLLVVLLISAETCWEESLVTGALTMNPSAFKRVFWSGERGHHTSDRITLLSHPGKWWLFSRWKGRHPLPLNWVRASLPQARSREKLGLAKIKCITEEGDGRKSPAVHHYTVSARLTGNCGAQYRRISLSALCVCVCVSVFHLILIWITYKGKTVWTSSP